MSEDCLEFKMKPAYWLMPFIIALFTGLFSLSLFITMFSTREAIHGMTALAVLFMCGANIYAGIRNRNNASVLITQHALHIGTQTFHRDDIKHIELNDPQKIIFRLASCKKDYRKTLNVDAIVPQQQEQFKAALMNINEQIRGRTKSNDTGK